LYQAGKINAQSLRGDAHCAFLKSSKDKAEVTRMFVTKGTFIVEERKEFACKPIKANKSGEAWCPEEDSNLHTLRHTDLNRARLPIPPSGQ
jgi:hypothetical protein